MIVLSLKSATSCFENAGELNGKAQRHRVGKETGKVGHAIGVVGCSSGCG